MLSSSHIVCIYTLSFSGLCCHSGSREFLVLEFGLDERLFGGLLVEH